MIAARICREWLGLLATTLLVASCASPLTAAPSPSASATPSSLDSPTPGSATPAPAETPSDAHDASTLGAAYLVQQLGIPRDQITTVSIEPTQWPDSSLGCPQPGVLYIQAITLGYRIVLQANGEQYALHVAGGRAILCTSSGTAEPAPAATVVSIPSPLPILTVAPSVTPIDLDPRLIPLMALAKSDLSRRLGVPVGDIVLNSAVSARWRDSSLGCPEPGKAYLDVVTPGYRILLAVGGTTYEYHCDQRQVVFCQNPQPPLP